MDKIKRINRAGLLGDYRPARVLSYHVIASKLLICICIILCTLTTSIAQKKPIEKLYTKENVDQDLKYLVKNLEKHHPLLYIYTSEQDFENRLKAIFDHVRYPITLGEYYYFLSLALSSLKHGHMRLDLDRPKLSASEQSSLYQMQYEVINNEVFIICTDTTHKEIIPGSRLVSINGSDVSDIIAQYENAIISDGSAPNHNRLLINVPILIEVELGIVDSVRMELLHNDQTYIYQSPRLKKQSSSSLSYLQCIKNRNLEEFGFAYNFGKSNTPFIDSLIVKNNISNAHSSNNLRFQDSTFRIAYWSIDRFTVSNMFDPKAVVDVLNKNGTEHLIIDLRYNMGGNVYNALITNLLLADSSFSMMDKLIATTRFRSALMKINQLNSLTDYLILPAQLPILAYNLARIKKVGENSYLHNSIFLTKKWAPVKSSFKGEVYVLINSGTFSAATALANALQQSGRATLFGTETGDAAWGGAAGTFKTVHLPNSRMKVTYGIFWMSNHLYDLQYSGRGVIPDYLVPDATIEEVLKGIDPQMQFVLQYIREKDKKQ